MFSLIKDKVVSLILQSSNIQCLHFQSAHPHTRPLFTDSFSHHFVAQCPRVRRLSIPNIHHAPTVNDLRELARLRFLQTLNLGGVRCAYHGEKSNPQTPFQLTSVQRVIISRPLPQFQARLHIPSYNLLNHPVIRLPNVSMIELAFGNAKIPRVLESLQQPVQFLSANVYRAPLTQSGALTRLCPQLRHLHIPLSPSAQMEGRLTTIRGHRTLQTVSITLPSSDIAPLIAHYSDSEIKRFVNCILKDIWNGTHLLPYASRPAFTCLICPV